MMFKSEPITEISKKLWLLFSLRNIDSKYHSESEWTQTQNQMFSYSTLFVRVLTTRRESNTIIQFSTPKREYMEQVNGRIQYEQHKSSKKC